MTTLIILTAIFFILLLTSVILLLTEKNIKLGCILFGLAVILAITIVIIENNSTVNTWTINPANPASPINKILFR